MIRYSWGLVLAIVTLSWLSMPDGALAEDKGAVVEIDGLRSRVPEAWKEEKSGGMRYAQFRVPKVGNDKDDAELIIFFFGPGGGGSVEDNLKRWKGQFNPPKDKTIDDASTVTKFKVGDVHVTLLEMTGAYKFKAQPMNPKSPEELKPDFRFLGAIFESQKGPYFIKFVGPDKTVDANKKGFEEWLKKFQ